MFVSLGYLFSDTVQNMWNSDWIDEKTRAVFLEFNLYNPNADLFTVAVIMFEFSNNGGIIPSHHFLSSKLYAYSTDFEVMMTVCQLMFLCFNIGFAYIERKKYKVLGRHAYFKDFWSYIEITQIILAYLGIGLFFQKLVSVNSTVNDFRTSSKSTYISFYAAISWDMILSYMMGFLIAVATLKAIKLLKFNRRAYMVGDTLSHSRALLVSFLVLAVLVGMAFSHCAVIAFGTLVYGYRDIMSSVMTVFNFSLGVSDLPGLQSTNRILGPVFFVVFVLVVQFCFLTVFVAILNFGISDSKAKFLQRKNKFELMDYMKTKVKTVLNIK